MSREDSAVKFTRARALMALGALAIVFPLRANAQAAVPMRELSRPEGVTVHRFGVIQAVQPLANGGVLVNDARHRELVAYDSVLAAFSVVLDSMPGGVVRYGPLPSELHAFRGDSMLFRDGATSVLIVMDPLGNFVRPLQDPARPRMQFQTPRGFDAAGNPITNGMAMRTRSTSGKIVTVGGLPVVRVNLEKQKVEDVGEIRSTVPGRVTRETDSKGQVHVKQIVNPLMLVDDWTVLSDGTVAFVRGDDYRVELVRPDGKKVASAKLPFEKRRLNDNDKRKFADSVRVAMEALAADGDVTGPAAAATALLTGMSRISRDSLAHMTSKAGGAFTLQVKDVDGTGTGSASIRVRGDTLTGRAPVANEFAFSAPEIEMVPLREMLDFVPPFNPKAAVADGDANLWILTNNVAGLNAGETQYDVVNNRAELFQRVRIPAGRSIAGFGHGGVVYLKYRDGTNGWVLERTRVVADARSSER